MKSVFRLLPFSVLFVLSAAGAAPWYVDGSIGSSGDGTSWEAALKTIQEGIDKALEGDTVIVAEGVYVENVHVDGKNIILTSTDPTDPAVVAATIVDGNQAGSVITFKGTENESCVLSGFTIRNGKAPAGGGVDGGWSRSLAKIRNNTITGNSAQWLSGGGLGWCAGTIENNTITGNSACIDGGGIDECDGTIENNIIAENSSGAKGGGLNGCDGTIQNNTITGNSASEGGGLADCH